MKIVEEKKGSPIFHRRQTNSNNANCPTCAQFYEKNNHISPFQLKLQISFNYNITEFPSIILFNLIDVQLELNSL